MARSASQRAGPGGPRHRRGQLRAALAALLLAGATIVLGGPDGTAAVTTIDAGATTPTIQAALSGSAPGDTVELAAGAYTLTATLSVPAGVTLAGAGPDAATGTVLGATGVSTAVAVTGSGAGVRDLRIVKSVGGRSGRGIDVGTTNATVTDLTLAGVTVVGADLGLRVGQTVSVVGWTISDSTFEGNRIGWYLAKEVANTSTISGLVATGVTFRDNLQKGCYIEKLEDSVLEGMTIEASGTDPTYQWNAGCDINLKWSDYADIELRDIVATGSGLDSDHPQSNGAAITIKARDDAPSYHVPPASLTGVVVDGLVTTGGQVGLRFGEPGKGNGGPAGVVVTNSSIAGTVTGLDNESLATVVADGNWWGQASGPAPGQVDGPVTVERWCVDGACAASSDDARLTGLTIAPGTLSPAFDPATTAYSASVGNAVNAVTVSATAAPGGTAAVSSTVLANLGANTVTVTVTAADGTTTRTYTISVVRAFPEPAPTTTTTPTPTTVPAPGSEPPPPVLLPVIARPPTEPPPPPPPPAAPEVVGVVSTPSGNGSIQVTPAGAIIVVGDAPDLGGVDDVALQAPATGLALTPTGAGYWVVAADGGVFSFGDAPFLGSAATTTLNEPVVGLAPTPSGVGYLTVAKDGGVFAFGDAPFLGSMAAVKLNAPVTSATFTPTGKGYVLVGEDGGIFTFGDAPFHGSAVGRKPGVKARSVTMTTTGGGYWVTFADGTVLAFGDAQPR